MPRFVFIANTQVILSQKLDVWLEERPTFLIYLYLAYQLAGTGLAVRCCGFNAALWQKVGTSGRTSQCHFKNTFGVLAGLWIIWIVSQHLVGSHNMIDIVWPLLASFNFPAAEMWNIQQRFCENVQ